MVKIRTVYFEVKIIEFVNFKQHFNIYFYFFSIKIQKKQVSGAENEPEGILHTKDMRLLNTAWQYRVKFVVRNPIFKEGKFMFVLFI